MSIIVGQSILFILDLLTMTSNMIKRVKLRVCFSRRVGIQLSYLNILL